MKGQQTNAVETSRKTPLLLLSGLLCDNSVWEDTAKLLADVTQVSIISFAGCRSIPEMAAKVLAQAPPRFALAGHSMGGRVALEVIRAAPDRVTRLALLNTGVHPRQEQEVAGRQRLCALAETDGMAAVADAWLPPMMSPAGRQNPALMQRLKAMVTRHSPVEFHGQIQALLNRPNAAEVLPQIAIPTLFLSGTEDQWSPIAQHETMQQQVPGSTLVALAGVGHMSVVEAPQLVAQALRDLVLLVTS